MALKKTETIQQETKAAEAYLQLKLAHDKAYANVIVRLVSLWSDVLSESYVPDENVLYLWLEEFGPDEVERAIRIAASQNIRPHRRLPSENAPYVKAILRNRKREAQ